MEEAARANGIRQKLESSKDDTVSTSASQKDNAAGASASSKDDTVTSSASSKDTAGDASSSELSSSSASSNDMSDSTSEKIPAGTYDSVSRMYKNSPKGKSCTNSQSKLSKSAPNRKNPKPKTKPKRRRTALDKLCESDNDESDNVYASSAEEEDSDSDSSSSCSTCSSSDLSTSSSEVSSSTVSMASSSRSGVDSDTLNRKTADSPKKGSEKTSSSKPVVAPRKVVRKAYASKSNGSNASVSPGKKENGRKKAPVRRSPGSTRAPSKLPNGASPPASSHSQTNGTSHPSHSRTNGLRVITGIVTSIPTSPRSAFSGDDEPMSPDVSFQSSLTRIADTSNNGSSSSPSCSELDHGQAAVSSASVKVEQVGAFESSSSSRSAGGDPPVFPSAVPPSSTGASSSRRTSARNGARAKSPGGMCPNGAGPRHDKSSSKSKSALVFDDATLSVLVRNAFTSGAVDPARDGPKALTRIVERQVGIPRGSMRSACGRVARFAHLLIIECGINILSHTSKGSSLSAHAQAFSAVRASILENVSNGVVPEVPHTSSPAGKRGKPQSRKRKLGTAPSPSTSPAPKVKKRRGRPPRNASSSLPPLEDPSGSSETPTEADPSTSSSEPSAEDKPSRGRRRKLKSGKAETAASKAREDVVVGGRKPKRFAQGDKKYYRYKCPECNKDVSNIRQHISLKHGSDRPFKCEVSGCGKAFKVRHHLTQHMKVHSDVRPFKCDFCAMTFKFQQAKENHERTHSGETPYECKSCDSKFTTLWRLRRHEFEVHPHEQDATGTTYQHFRKKRRVNLKRRVGRIASKEGKLPPPADVDGESEEESSTKEVKLENGSDASGRN